MTLLTKQGNAFDTASLLIALLRASNIPARYVYGTIELPIDKVMNWVGGFTDANSAVDLIASGGIPGIVLTSGGSIVAVRMEHVWVEAFVPYGNYRGVKRDESIKTWIPMDGSFKQYTYKDPIDFPAAVGFDIQAFINEVQSASTVDPSNSSISNVPQDLILQRIQSYVQNVHQYYDTNLQGKTAEDVIGSKRVITKEYPYLLGSLPYKTIVVGNKFSQVPNTLRWRINFEIINSLFSLGPDLSYAAATAFLAGKSLTLGYKPSTPYDESLVQTYGYIEKVPPYLLNLTPELIINGEVVALGAPVGSGNDVDFIMTFISPNGSQDAISNKETVGAYLGVGLDLNWFSKSLLDQRISALEEIYNNPAPSSGRKIQENLSLLASLYFAELDAMNRLGKAFSKVVSVRHPSVAIVGSDLKVGYLWGVPRRILFAGLFIDVDRDVHSVAARDGDKTKVKAFNMLSGHNSSSMEHALWDHVYNLPGVSAVKVHQLANEMAIPIHKVDQSNISTVLSLLQISNESKSDILNAVNSGKTVYVPQRNLQYYDWTGTAYIVLDPNTAAGAYIISGGISGGKLSLLLDCLEALIQLVDIIPIPGVPGLIVEFLTLAATAHDIEQSHAPEIVKDVAALLAALSFVVGISGIFIPVTIPAVIILEAIFYVSIFTILEGGLPIIHKIPIQDCIDLFKRRT